MYVSYALNLKNKVNLLSKSLRKTHKYFLVCTRLLCLHLTHVIPLFHYKR